MSLTAGATSGAFPLHGDGLACRLTASSGRVSAEVGLMHDLDQDAKAVDARLRQHTMTGVARSAHDARRRARRAAVRAS